MQYGAIRDVYNTLGNNGNMRYTKLKGVSFSRISWSCQCLAWRIVNQQRVKWLKKWAEYVNYEGSHSPQLFEYFCIICNWLGIYSFSVVNESDKHVARIQFKDSIELFI